MDAEKTKKRIKKLKVKNEIYGGTERKTLGCGREKRKEEKREQERDSEREKSLTEGKVERQTSGVNDKEKKGDRLGQERDRKKTNRDRQTGKTAKGREGGMTDSRSE